MHGRTQEGAGTGDNGIVSLQFHSRQRPFVQGKVDQAAGAI